MSATSSFPPWRYLFSTRLPAARAAPNGLREDQLVVAPGPSASEARIPESCLLCIAALGHGLRLAALANMCLGAVLLIGWM